MADRKKRDDEKQTSTRKFRVSWLVCGKINVAGNVVDVANGIAEASADVADALAEMYGVEEVK